MNKFARFFGISLMALAVAIAVVPSVTDCQSQGKDLELVSGKHVPMKCHWTAQAEIATGAPLVAVGAVVVATRRKENLRTLGIIGGVLGVFAILLPTSIIGVCQTPTMLCHTVMRPALSVLGSLAIAGSVGAIVLSRKSQE